MYNNPENMSPDDILRQLKYLTHSVICAVGTTENRCKRIKVLESYNMPIKISNEQWIKKFCK